MAEADDTRPNQKGDETLQDSDEDEIFYDARFPAEEEAVRRNLLRAILAHISALTSIIGALKSIQHPKIRGQQAFHVCALFGSHILL